MAAIAADILAQAPPRFALAGLSMGGYIALTMLRQAPERIAKLALLDTSARPDTPEQTAVRQQLIGLAHVGKLNQVVDALAPRFLHRDRRDDAALNRIIRDMAADTGAEAFVRQEKAIMGAAGCAAGACDASAVRRWCWWARATNSRRRNWRGRSRRA